MSLFTFTLLTHHEPVYLLYLLIVSTLCIMLLLEKNIEQNENGLHYKDKNA